MHEALEEDFLQQLAGSRSLLTAHHHQVISCSSSMAPGNFSQQLTGLGRCLAAAHQPGSLLAAHRLTLQAVWNFALNRKACVGAPRAPQPCCCFTSSANGISMRLTTMRMPGLAWPGSGLAQLAAFGLCGCPTSITTNCLFHFLHKWH